MGAVEHDPGVVHASNLDRIVAYTRDAEALDRIFREVDDDAHGNRRGFRVFRVFHFVGRCTLTRQRQRGVGAPALSLIDNHCQSTARTERAIAEIIRAQFAMPCWVSLFL